MSLRKGEAGAAQGLRGTLRRPVRRAAKVAVWVLPCVLGAALVTWLLWDTVATIVQVRLDRPTFEHDADSFFVQSVAISPDGKRIVGGGSQGEVTLWDATSGREIRQFKGHGNSPQWHANQIASVAFSPDGKRIVSGSRFFQTIKVWDATNGGERLSLDAGPVFSVAFSPNGERIVSAGWDINVWDAASGRCLLTIKVPGPAGCALTCAAFSPDGIRILAGSATQAATIWDAKTGQQIFTLEGQDEQTGPLMHVAFLAPSHAAFSPDGRQIVGGLVDHTIKVWDAKSGRVIRILQGHTDMVWEAAFSPDSKRIVSGSEDTTIKLWDAASGHEISTLLGHTAGVMRVAFSPDGTRIISASAYPDNTIRIWDATTRREILRLPPKTQ